MRINRQRTDRRWESTPPISLDKVTPLQWALVAHIATTCPPEDFDEDLARKLHSFVYQSVGQDGWDQAEFILAAVRGMWARDEGGVRTRWLESYKQNHP